MDYIRKQIEQRIDFLQTMGDKNALKQHFQARFEYVLVYLFAYLWNKNLDKLEYEDKEFVFQSVLKPTIGSIVSICRKLDTDKEIFTKSKLSQALDKYPSVRNELLGHGFVYEDAPDKLLSALQGKPSSKCILFERFMATKFAIKKQMAQAVSMQALMYSKIRDWQESGLSQKGWCEAHQIKYHIFHYWYKRYRSSEPSAATQEQFIALQIQPAASTTCGCLELILVDGKRLLFHQPVSTDYLKALIS